jgi:hypothetical protein
MMRLRFWLRQAIHILFWTAFAALIVGIRPTAAQPVAKTLSPERFFIGAAADHFVDSTGQMTIETVAAERSFFTPADGRAANRGVSPSADAALWLRLKIPNLDPDLGWVISLHESRISSAALFFWAGP